MRVRLNRPFFNIVANLISYTKTQTDSKSTFMAPSEKKTINCLNVMMGWFPEIVDRS